MQGLFKTSIASIMGDFGKKITALKAVQSGENKGITTNKASIKALKEKNFAAQAEISAAQKAINALEQFTGGE